MEYTIDYFIDKFTKIPIHAIGKGDIASCCALYHCGVTETNEDCGYTTTEEAEALIRIFANKDINITDRFSKYRYVYAVNDGLDDNYKLGNTPKDRILNKLKQLKEQHPY